MLFKILEYNFILTYFYCKYNLIILFVKQKIKKVKNLMKKVAISPALCCITDIFSTFAIVYCFR